MSGKCPKCEKPADRARMAPLDVSDGTLVILAFAASCPHCNTILGVVPDPRPRDEKLDLIIAALNAPGA